MKKKALLFDFDGVLLDSEPLHFLAWTRLLEKLSIQDPSFIYEEVIGVSDLSLAEHFISHFSLKIPASELLERKREEFLLIMKNEPLKAPEEEAILATLKKDYILAVVSSSHSDEIEFVLKKLALRHFFSHIVAGNHVIHHKPDPEPYLKALKDLHLKPTEAIVIEDSFPGMQSALGADLPVIWINRYNEPLPPLEGVFPITKFKEILSVLPSISLFNNTI